MHRVKSKEKTALDYEEGGALSFKKKTARI